MKRSAIVLKSKKIAVLLCFLSFGCKKSVDSQTTVSTTVILLDKDQQHNNVVALRSGSSSSYSICSGSLISPNVVLTARHCFYPSSAHKVVCTPDGVSKNGNHFQDQVEIPQIGIFLGASPIFSEDPVAIAKEYYVTESKVVCNSDIGIIILDKEIQGVKPLKIRLKKSPVLGEKLFSVGYGKNEEIDFPGSKSTKYNVKINLIRSPWEFETTKSLCSGDSGGPTISVESGAIVGIASRVASCNEDNGHTYIAIGQFADLLNSAEKHSVSKFEIE